MNGLGPLRIKTLASDCLREDVSLHPSDARQLGFDSNGRLAIWSTETELIGPPRQKHAVRVLLDGQVEPGTAVFNQRFFEENVFDETEPCSLEPCPQVHTVRKAVLEMVTEQSVVTREIGQLRDNRKQLFENRCLLLYPEQKEGLSLPVSMNGAGSSHFNIRSIEPEIRNVLQPTALIFDENTELSFFVPHRRSGVDMVIVVDGSYSMDLRDYVNEQGHPLRRLDGAKDALDRLFQKRLVSGTRISRIGVIVFGQNTRQIYPYLGTNDPPCMVDIKDEEQLEDIRQSLRYINDMGLQQSGLNRGGTEIPQAIQYAADLLDMHFREGNEKLILLLSDGADWRAEQDIRKGVELVAASSDPALLAESLHYESEIRFYSVAISNRENVLRYEPRHAGKPQFVPNVELLQQISGSTDGLFFPQPDARALAVLLDDLGQGIIYSL